MNQKLALRLLAQMGYEADVAGNGIEADRGRRAADVRRRARWTSRCRRWTASRRRARFAPGEPDAGPRIVAMTANAMDGDREACFAAGMDDYVSKPIRVAELVAALEQRRPQRLS